MLSTLKIPLRTGRCYSVFTVQRLLSEEHLKNTAAKFAKMKPVKTQPQPSTKNAAVLIPLCVVNGQVSLLYTLRAANLKTHRGQVSFPGGMEDAGDKNPAGTALRETHEELGILPDQVQVWGTGNVVLSKGLTSVLPVIGVIKSDNVMNELNVNHDEVTEVFTVPVEVLCDSKQIKHTQFRPNYSIPVYLGGKQKIWGLTAVITHLFLKSFVPKEAYGYNITFINPLKSSLPYRAM